MISQKLVARLILAMILTTILMVALAFMCGVRVEIGPNPIPLTEHPPEILESEESESEPEEDPVPQAPILESIMTTSYVTFEEVDQDIEIEEVVEIIPENIPISYSSVNAFDLRSHYYVELEILEEYLSRYPYLDGLAESFIDGQDTHEVNLIFTLSIIRLESGNGKYKSNTNNIAGLTANGYYAPFDSLDDCVSSLYRQLSNNYLEEDGKYFVGYTVSDVQYYYCGVNPGWSSLVQDMMVEVYYGLEEIANTYEMI